MDILARKFSNIARRLSTSGKKTPVAALAAIALLGSPNLVVAASETPVSTEQGKLAGNTRDGIDSYLGIPYAAPPVGANRWRSPQPATAWQGVKAAKTFGASCVQAPGAPGGAYTEEFVTPGPFAEDCLFLNIWTKKAAAARRPVLVWIHGGGFSIGSGAMPMFDGAALAAKGVVVVTLNYRLGPFGYLAHPGLSAEDPHHSSGTYGLQDQAAALRWVHRNITAFGGDPGNVTVMGESAGAISTNGLILSPLAAGLFHRAVVLSGSGMGFPAPNLRDAETFGASFAEKLGAPDVAALRALPAEKILAAVPWNQELPPAAITFPFWPVVDQWALPADPDLGSSRPRSPVPMMTGFNQDENFLIMVRTVADFESLVKGWFGSRADRILALYPHATDAEAAVSAKVLARDRYMTSLSRWTSARASSSDQIIYQYVYDHPSPTRAGPNFGSFHSAGISYFFGNLDPATRPFAAGDRTVSSQVQDDLIAFIKTGNPNRAGRPQWPRVNESKQVMAFGLKPGLRDAVSSPARLEALRDHARNGGRLSLF
ncbi:carboxylesterase/lipase family protein [Sphingobium boeckii]|uniref:Carboxylic ester hydrolase n=1 Tax=Sphingobium boeckii TaxID=1082345 RepID=A0A7W9AHD5_9SPHN|nr:carboxylesterase/lipase family protein [Sphingobium boeckii]MBB5685679.1 para-nitrobenzyl esterase [Sphingobium boeckii]